MGLKKFKLLLTVICLALSLQLVLAGDSNGVWHDAEDARGGVFASDEDRADFFFIDRVGINTNSTAGGQLVVNGTIVSSALNVSGSIASEGIVDAGSPGYSIDLGNESIFNTIIAQTIYGGIFYGLSDQNYFLDIDANSRLKNLNVDTFTIGGVPIDNIYVNEGQVSSITSSMITDSTIVSADIQDSTIVSADIQDNTIVSADIQDSTIVSADIQDSTIVSADIQDSTIVSADIQDSTIVSADIANGAVTSADIADGTVTSADIADGTVTSADIADGTVGSGDIADGTIGVSDLNIASVDSRYVNLAGDTISGAITFSSPVTFSSSVTLPGGVDLDAKYVNTGGDTMTGGLTIGGDLTVYGAIGGETFLYVSDRRLKENIETLSNSLEKVKSLNGVSFDWKKSGLGDIGFIAQEVEEVLPVLVHEDAESGLKSVKYGNIVALLVESIKEQQKQIDALKIEVEKLNR